ncbi:MAG: hypothetical protein ACOYU7_00060 [Bacillota bacterium]
MGRLMRDCRCGNVYVHDELESPECPICGRVGKLYQRTFHRCENCDRIEVCPPERKEARATSGVCPYFKRPDLVRYKRH